MSALTVTPIQLLDQPALQLRQADGSEATVLLYGGHVLSFRPAQGEELLYLSPLATTAGGTAVRGGVPLIFPSFDRRGPEPGVPRHGFARKALFTYVGSDENGVHLTLQEDPATLAVFPHPFRLSLRVGLSATALTLRFAVQNCSASAFAFTGALHTYLRVSDIAQARVLGLAGRRYVDTARAGAEGLEAAERLKIEGEVDRIYGDVHQLVLVDGPRQVRVTQAGFTDAVVWNPGPELAAGLADLPDAGYRQMLCLEAAKALSPLVLAAGEFFEGSQAIELL